MAHCSSRPPHSCRHSNGAAKRAVTDALNRSRVTGTPPKTYLVLDESDAPPTYRREVLDKTPTITKRSRGRERAAARREHANAASSTSVHSPQRKAEDEAKVGAEAEEAEAEAEAMPPWKVAMLAKRRTKQASAQATPSKPETPLGVGRAPDLPDLPDLRIDLPTALRNLRVEMAAASSSSKQLDCIEVRCAYFLYLSYAYPTACPHLALERDLCADSACTCGCVGNPRTLTPAQPPPCGAI